MDIDFRVRGLSHTVVKEAEIFSVQELVKKIESRPHREALQANLQQNNVYNPFSDDAKAMIREMGNVELFELCETVPKVQCSQCLLRWNQGIIYCTCGHLLFIANPAKIWNKWRLDGQVEVWYRDDSPHLSWKCAQVTGKAGENGQHPGEVGGSSPWTRPSAPECGDTLKALADDQRPI